MADYLPVEIVLNILSRLPAETVLTCKQVCKTWHNHLSHSDRLDFAKAHLLQLNQRRHDHNSLGNGVTGSKVSLGFIFLLKSENIRPNGHPLWHVRYDENNNGTVQKTLRPINHPLIRTKKEYDTNLLVGSCNGLICFAEPGRRNVRDPIHICNPITRECVYLKGFNENIQYKSTWSIHSGFGYSSLTNEYKVVRILCYYSRDHGAIGQIQVYTLGSGDGWRNKGVLTNYLLDSIYAVFANGALHWLHSSLKEIMAFNLSDEKFNVLPSGPFYFPTYRERFWFLRSWGEALYGVGPKEEYFDVWCFKITSSDGITNNTAASTCNEYESWSWCKEFSITRSANYSPFAVTKSGLVVMWDWSTFPGTKTLYYYNYKTSFVTSLGDLNNSIEVIPHTNSFVSLNDLGETTCKKRKKGTSSGGVKDHN